ncbi:hypothetical protein [Vibrio sp. HN007]|uniref:hypothetical protein n=1 Tax=Vibrio iocasae TaxID=3098914 RepID=UPI0035D435EF
MVAIKLILLGFVISLLSEKAFADIEEDKKLHLGLSAALGYGTQMVTQDWITSFGVCVAVGAAKELYDKMDYGHASSADLAYNTVGCAMGVGLNHLVGPQIRVFPTKNLDGATLNLKLSF